MQTTEKRIKHGRKRSIVQIVDAPENVFLRIQLSTRRDVCEKWQNVNELSIATTAGQVQQWLGERCAKPIEGLS